MASIKNDVKLKFQTTKDGDIEEKAFSAGDEVTVVSKWSKHVLVKDDDGHYYNVPKDNVAE